MNSFHIKANLAFGGNPFTHQGVDKNLTSATFTIKSFKVWKIDETDPQPPQSPCLAPEIKSDPNFDCTAPLQPFSYQFSNIQKNVQSVHVKNYLSKDFSPAVFLQVSALGSALFTDPSTKDTSPSSVCSKSNPQTQLVYKVSYKCDDSTESDEVTLTAKVKQP